MSSTTLVSVVIPTHHRPALLRRAVASILAQDHPAFDVEVIVAVSDPDDPADTATADDLARLPAVRRVLATGPGAAAARNAGIRKARGSVIAFIDDDCVAHPDWLRNGVLAVDRGGDLVQGRTWPSTVIGPFDRTLWVDRMSWLWETCNLLVRREAIERGGLFDESWTHAGQAGRPWGEDTEWGWRLVRAGARPVFAEDVLVSHAVIPGTFATWLLEKTDLRFAPMVLRSCPEVRRRFFGGYFLNQRHALLLAVATGWAMSIALRRHIDPRTRQRLKLLAATAYLSYMREAQTPADLASVVGELPRRVAGETVEIAALLYGSLRWRRLLL